MVAISAPATSQRPPDPATSMATPRVVIVGGGFGGLTAAQALRRAAVEIFLIDRTNHHLFQPLLYQVATAALSPADIASPLRGIFRGQRNVRVMMSEVLRIDRARRQVVLPDGTVTFDYLILAPGSRHSYFGHDEWEAHAPGLKTLNDALVIRERTLLALERAERLGPDPQRRRYLTFAVVGGGPTGVELAGALAEIARETVLPDFPSLRADEMTVYLLEAGPRILSGFHPSLAEKAQRTLEKLGVTVSVNAPVTAVSDEGVQAGGRFIDTATALWAPGSVAPSFLQSLDVPLDKQGHVYVEKDLSIPEDPCIFVIGDAAHATDRQGNPLPALAPVAMQQARYVARLIERQSQRSDRPPFVYHDRGSLATIGKGRAIAEIGRFRTSGVVAWVLWALVHIYFLIGFRNRFRVMSEWIWYYLTNQPGARLIHGRASQSRAHPD